MSVTVPGTIPAESLRAWYDDQQVDDVVLYDITAQTATSLSAMLIARRRAAGDEREREHWSARMRLVAQQQAVLNPEDRAGLIAQQQAWLDEAHVLSDQAAPQPA